MLNNLCDVPGVLVGHATDPAGMTGCTAILFEKPAVVGVDVRGSSPETRGTAGLGQTGIVRHRQGILLTGGSAFGLTATDGMIRYLEERGTGLDVGVARVPLVSAAVLFDLAVGSPDARPTAEMGYEAAVSAGSGAFEEGSVGAGTGASVGNILGMDRAIKGGLGSASARPDGEGGDLIVAALAAVNAFGDVRDPQTGRTVAGPRLDGGALGDTVALMPEAAARVRWGENTTLGVVATNARLDTSQVRKVAEMGHDGLARAISPVHTTVDGDLVFAAAVGDVDASTDVVGAWGARLLSEAILRAVRAASGIPGLPSVSEL